LGASTVICPFPHLERIVCAVRERGAGHCAGAVCASMSKEAFFIFAPPKCLSNQAFWRLFCQASFFFSCFFTHHFADERLLRRMCNHSFADNRLEVVGCCGRVDAHWRRRRSSFGCLRSQRLGMSAQARRMEGYVFADVARDEVVRVVARASPQCHGLQKHTHTHTRTHAHARTHSRVIFGLLSTVRGNTFRLSVN
jgi:hypothetical protein